MGTLANCCASDTNEGNKKLVKSKVKTTEADTIQAIIQQNVNTRCKDKSAKHDFDDFLIEGYIGNGAFGVVFLGQLKSNIAKGITQKYAIKKVSKEILKKQRVLENAKLDQQILKWNRSNFIVALQMAFQDTYFIYYVMQFASGGDTYSLIKQKSLSNKDFKALGENAIRFIGACVILGLQFLHQNNIMYRDLKPQNVLLMNNGYVKLTDFGLAKKQAPTDQKSKTISGTALYYAPQMVLKSGYTKDVDIWTLGVYFYQLAVTKPPFHPQVINRHKFKNAVLEAQKNRNFQKVNLSPELMDLINKILRFQPKQRLGSEGNFQSLKDHAFFKDFDWKSLEQQKMQSPLKDIVAKYPVAIKPYKNDPSNAEELSTQSQAKIEGWTYVRK